MSGSLRAGHQDELSETLRFKLKLCSWVEFFLRDLSSALMIFKLIESGPFILFKKEFFT